MRFAALALFILLANTAPAQDAPDARQRAKAALALAAQAQPDPMRAKAATALADAAGCGACRSDIDQAKLDAKAANKVLVVFVGGCAGKGQVTASAGAIPVRSTSYKDDETPRVVVLYPAADGGLYVSETLKGDAGEGVVKKAVAEASKKVGK